MEGPIPAYEGTDAYAFVSYAHDDAAAVFPDIRDLHHEGFAIWYDDGIHAGSSWPAAIAEKISNCSVFLYFSSKSAAGSAHCQRELHFATETVKPIIVIQVDEEPVPAAVRFVLGQQQALMKVQLHPDTYRTRLYTALGQHLTPGQSTTGDPAPYDGKSMARIAITPFETDGDQVHEALAQDLNEDLLMEARFVDLVPAAPRLVQQAFAENESPRSLARALGTSWILYGQVRRKGDETSVRFELVDAGNGDTTWVGRFRVPYENAERYANYLRRECIVALFSRVTARIASDTEHLPLTALDLPSLNARLANRAGPRDRDALALIERMIELEPNNPVPKAQLAQALSVRVANRAQGPSDADYPVVAELVSQAWSLARDNARVAHHCSFALRNIGEQQRGLEMARRSYALSRDIASTNMLITCLISNGLAEEARGYLDDLASWYPPAAESPYAHLERDYYILIEDWSRALPFARRCSNQEGPGFLARIKEAMILAELDHMDDAIDMIETARSLFPKLSLRRAVPGLAMANNHMPQFFHGIEKLIECGVN